MGTWRHSVVGSVVALVVMAVLVAVMVPLRSHLSIATPGLVLVVPVVIGVVVGGFKAGAFGVVAGFLVYDLVFIPPYFTLSVGGSENWVPLGVYVAVMLAVAQVVARLETARAEANQHEQAIRRLFELTDLLIEDRPLSEVLELIVSTVHEAFALAKCRPPAPRRDPSRVVASAGAPVSDVELRRSRPNPGFPPAWEPPAGRRHDQTQTVALTAMGRPIGLLRIWGAALTRTTRSSCTPSPITWLSPSNGRNSVSRRCGRSCSRRSTASNAPSWVRSHTTSARPWPRSRRRPRRCAAPMPTLALVDREELLELIDNQTDRLNRLVTNLLDLSRVQAGALELRNEPIAVGDLVADALRGLGPRADALHITTRLDVDLPLVDVDHLLIGQVLANLLDNATRYAPPGTAISISTRLRDDGLVELAVQDEGPGVPRAERTNVFQMFNRSGTSGGTGVGLSIAKAFVEAHGQEIWVEDVPGGGARFCFTMPPAPVTMVVT